MKKKIWNKENVPSTRSTGFWLRINPKSGSITMSQELSKEFPDNLQFVQNEDKPGDWYLEPTKDTNAFALRAKNKMMPALIQSCALAKIILKSCNLELVSTYFLVSHEIEKGTGFAIITKRAKQAA